MPPKTAQLPPELVEQILTKLGLSEPPPADVAGLTRLYKAWCRKVPFDNIRKRIHLTKNSPLPLPGYDDREFFRGWLRYGVGGTCWAGNAALSALLEALGFSCERGLATMLTDSKQPPNHGTVCVQCDEERFLVDASMLHSTPLLLRPEQPSAIDHPAWGLTCSPLNQLWSIRWRPLHLPEGCTCRIEAFSISRKAFHRFNEMSRKKSPFNDSLYIRLNTAESVIGISDGMSVNFAPDGELIQKRLTHQECLKVLIEQMAISEEILARIPP